VTDFRAQLQATLGDGYTLERELGGGGMSRVFVAREHALGREVVVKVLSPEHHTARAAVRRGDDSSRTIPCTPAFSR